MSKKFSGQLRLRMPTSLHRDLAEQAVEEGVSLNTYLLYLISKSYGNQIAPMTEPKSATGNTLIFGAEDNTYKSHTSMLVIPSTPTPQ